VAVKPIIFVLMLILLAVSVNAQSSQSNLLRVNSYFTSMTTVNSNITWVNAVNTSSTLITCSYVASGGSGSNNAWSMRWNLTNGSKINLQRQSTGVTLLVTCYVAEFDNGVVVQHGTKRQDAGENTITINSINQSASWMIYSAEHSAAVWSGDDHYYFRLRDGSTVIERNNIGILTFADYQVVTMKGAILRNGTLDMRLARANYTLTPLISNLSKAFPLVGTTASASGTNADQSGVQANFTNTSMIAFQRGGSTATLNLSWQAIEFTGDEIVQTGSSTFGTAMLTTNVTINAVNTSRAIAFPTGVYRYGKTTYSSNDNVGPVMVRLNITNSTNLRITRGLSGSAALDVQWVVVEFVRSTPAGGGGGDSCTYTGGTWTINCADNCVLSTPTNLAGNNIVFTGSGSISISALMSSWGRINKPQTCRVKWTGRVWG